MYYESDPEAFRWLDEMLCHPARRVRIDAVNALSVIDCVFRRRWLARAQRDSDPTVVATALVVEAQINVEPPDRFDLFESDLGTSLDAPDLEWEWEYSVAVCHETTFPGALTTVWTKGEDDAAAKRLAALKLYAGKTHEIGCARPFIVSKRLVTRFTRSPRSFAEARAWHLRGRPRYGGP